MSPQIERFSDSSRRTYSTFDVDRTIERRRRPLRERREGSATRMRRLTTSQGSAAVT